MPSHDSPLPLDDTSRLQNTTCPARLELSTLSHPSSKFAVSEGPLSTPSQLFTPGAQDNADLAGGLPDAIPPAPEALTVTSETTTPLREGLPDLGIASIVGSILPPEAALPTPPVARPSHELRLPSFEMLGIAAPHPDRIGSNVTQTTPWIGVGPLSQPSDPLHLQSNAAAGGHAVVTTAVESTPGSLSPAHLLPGHRSIQQYIVTHTPPDDSGKMDWTASEAKTAMPEQGSTSQASQKQATARTSTSAASTPGQDAATGLYRPNRQDAPWLKEALHLIRKFFHKALDPKANIFYFLRELEMNYRIFDARTVTMCYLCDCPLFYH
jgi:hypothetical protein